MQRAETSGFRIFARVSSLVCAIPVIPDGRPPPPPPSKRAALEISFLRVKGNGIEIGFSKLRAAPPMAMLLSGERNANTALLSAQLDRKTGEKRGWYRVDLQEYTRREECIVLSEWSQPLDFGLRTQSSLLNLNDPINRVIKKTDLCE